MFKMPLIKVDRQAKFLQKWLYSLRNIQSQSQIKEVIQDSKFGLINQKYQGVIHAANQISQEKEES
jgi:hypothetical protein